MIKQKEEEENPAWRIKGVSQIFNTDYFSTFSFYFLILKTAQLYNCKELVY